MQKYNIRKNWAASFSLMTAKPIVILPFIFIAFFEVIALGLIYFSPRKPLVNIFGPLIRKFFRETFLHYPGNLAILPKFFYYSQMAIYIFIGVALTAVSANAVKNIRESLPLKPNALVKNVFKRYLSCFVFGIFMIVCMLLLKRIDLFIFSRALKLVAGRLPQILLKLSPFISVAFLFLSNIILQTFLVLTIPILIIRKKSLFRALAGSIAFGWRNFISIFTLIFLPFLLYLPIILLKTASIQLVDKTFPEINLHITAFGIILAIFVECFVIVCAAQFLLDKEK